ncbi:MAG TPA: malonyl-CoA synthase [Hyphomicrobiales bacterium]|nr:malonyl-CoA synthase [Hyphomicrobiales bacterium]
MSESLFHAFQEANPGPGRIFLTTAEGRQLSYGALFGGALRYAAALASLGAQPGERVAVQGEKSVEGLLLYLGCLATGAVYLPLNPAYTPAEVEYFLSDAQPRILICDPARFSVLADVAARCGLAHIETLGADGSGTLPEIVAGHDSDFAPRARHGGDLAAILYTSGTTGRAKGAILSHGNLASNARTLAGLWRMNRDDVLLHALPIFHTHGLFVALSTVLLAGASMIWLPKFDAGAVVAALARSTVLMGVPTFYSRLLARADFSRETCANMRLFISGSAPLSAQTHQEFQARSGHAILERYGMTETGMNTSNPYEGERKPGTVGHPLPGVDLRIADPDSGAPLGPGEIGVIEVRGPNVTPGYWRNAEKTREAFRDDGFFITGDLGQIGADGYVSIVGSDKDLIISGGLNVYPAEVEAALDALPGIAESAVIGLPHGDFGEAVTAVLAARAGSKVNGAEIAAALGGKLAAFKIPKQVIAVDALPRNAMGKIEKAALRECYAGLYGDGSKAASR